MKLRIRNIVQILFFVLVALISINHSLAEAGTPIPILGSASLHAVCPFGSVVSIYQLVRSGTFVKKVHEASMVLLYIVLALGVLFGPVFCGWMCPLGSIQEWLSKIGERMGIKKRKIPDKADRYLRNVRYIILAAVVYKTAVYETLVFSDVDPYYAMFNFWTEDFVATSGMVLIIVLIMTMFIERAWCKYACPFGALLGLTNKFRIFGIKRNEKTCISCNKCTMTCPMDIDVMHIESVKDHQCISCMKCTSENECPVSNTVNLKSTVLGRNVNPKAVAIIAIVMVSGGISLAMATGNWSTESSKTPVTLESGEYDPADIRGSYTFKDVENAFGVPVETLKQAFMVPDEYDIDSFRNKELESLYSFDDETEIGNGSVKMFVSLYTQLPYDYESSGDMLPLSAYEILDEKGLIPEDKRSLIESRLVDLSSFKK